MRDVITYIPDLEAFRYEAVTKAENKVQGFGFNVDGSVYYGVNKIPVFYNGNESICLIRLTSQEEESVFSGISTCESIGECINGEYVFTGIDEERTYDRVRGDLSFSYIGDDGEEHVCSKSYKIGDFS